ncbi:hypothetical protein [Reticulibacter mediterranei]|nr:hypothetical protein [Reticulibacter mediterranei]
MRVSRKAYVYVVYHPFIKEVQENAADEFFYDQLGMLHFIG